MTRTVSAEVLRACEKSSAHCMSSARSGLGANRFMHDATDCSRIVAIANGGAVASNRQAIAEKTVTKKFTTCDAIFAFDLCRLHDASMAREVRERALCIPSFLDGAAADAQCVHRMCRAAREALRNSRRRHVGRLAATTCIGRCGASLVAHFSALVCDSEAMSSNLTEGSLVLRTCWMESIQFAEKRKKNCWARILLKG